jgi:hypothetical protein
MNHAEATEIVNRCGADRAPPAAGKLVHAWAGWADHEADPPTVIYTWKQVDEARRIVRDEDLKNARS